MASPGYSSMSDAELARIAGVTLPAASNRQPAPQAGPQTAPRGERNNNTGNIEDRGQFVGQPGYLGSDGRFARFSSPEAGQQAQVNQLQRYMRGQTTGRPLTSVNDIVMTWSPLSDPGNTREGMANYVSHVARRLGVDPNAQIGEDRIPELITAMGEFENGTWGGSVSAPQDVSQMSDDELLALVGDLGDQPLPAGATVDDNGFVIAPESDRWGTEQNPWTEASLQAADGDAKPGDWFTFIDEQGKPQTTRLSVQGNVGGGPVRTLPSGLRVRETGALQDIGAFASAFNEQLPFGDELAARTIGALTGQGYDAARADQAREREAAREIDMGARRAGGLAGFGTSLLAPTAAAGWLSRGGLGARSLKAGALGAGSGAFYGAASTEEGGLGNRAADALAGGIVGGVLGTSTPSVVQGVSAIADVVSAPAARFLNNISGGRLAQRYSPDARASRDLANSLRDDGVTPEAFEESLNRLRGLGVEPTMFDVIMDVAPNGKAARSVRGAAMHSDSSQIATRYARDTAEQIPALAQNRAREIVPTSRTTPEMLEGVQSRIDNAFPQSSVAPGSGGSAVSAALNAQRDAAKRGVDQAYQAARDLDPSRAMISPTEASTVQANILDSVRDWDMRDVPRVGRVLEGLQEGGAPSVRSLFEARSRLSNLRVSNDPVERAAASRAVASLDGEIDRLVDTNSITGDPAAVQAWRDANAARADFGRRFESGDLIDRITNREWRGGGMTNAIAPEDVSNLILGQGQGVASRANMGRDLERLQGMVPDAFRELQSEAGSRLMRMSGERVAPDLGVLSRQNPALERLLVTPQTRAAIDRAAQEVAQAQGQRAAIQTGQGILGETPDVFSRARQGADLRDASANAVVNALGANPTNTINRLARNPNTRENVDYAFGSILGREMSDTMGALGDRLRNSQFINPAGGSKTAQASMDAGEAVGMVSSLISGGKTAALGLLAKMASGVRLSSEERQALVRMGVSEGEAIRAAADPRISQYLVAPVSMGAAGIAVQ